MTRHPFAARQILLVLALALLFPFGASAQGGFQVLIRPPTTDFRRYAPYQQWMEQSRMLHLLAEGINEQFQIPENAWMTAEECGQVNAFWRPDVRVMTLCYELIDEIFGEFRYDGLSQEAFGTAVGSTTVFIAMHEVGHALVDLLNLPITGREEDVVDQFASIALGEDDPAPAWWAAEYWRTKGDFGDTGLFKNDMTPFEDEHSFDMQRFYNVLCWVYGKDPQNRTEMLRVLPQSRAARCPAEYQRMATSWETILGPHVRGAASGVGAGEGSGKVIFAGNWQMTEQIGALTDDLYCESQIQLNVEQTGNVFAAPFNQTGRCTIAGKEYDNPATGRVQGGRIDGTEISFRMETCTYVGRPRDGSNNLVVGTVSCAVQQEDGTTATVNGVWRATRQ